MATASDARAAAERYVRNDLSGSVSDLEFVGMTTTPEGRCVGFEVELDRGTSILGAVLGGLFLGLIVLLLAMMFGLLLALVGVPPSLLTLLGVVVTGAAVVSGAQNGAYASEVENVTVTVDGSGDVVMANRRLSPGEFSRAIDRSYDRQTSQFGAAVAQLSKHWLLHKVADSYLGSRDRD